MLQIDSKIIDIFKFKNKEVLCQIKILPREIKYYHGQSTIHRTYRWMQLEHWAQFEDTIENYLKKLWMKSTSNGINVELEPQLETLKFHLKHSVRLTINICTKKQLNKIDIKHLNGNIWLALDCCIEYLSKDKDTESVIKDVCGGEVVIENNVLFNLMSLYDNGKHDEYEPQFISKQVEDDNSKASPPTYTPAYKASTTITATTCPTTKTDNPLKTKKPSNRNIESEFTLDAVEEEEEEPYVPQPVEINSENIVKSLRMPLPKYKASRLKQIPTNNSATDVSDTDIEHKQSTKRVLRNHAKIEPQKYQITNVEHGFAEKMDTNDTNNLPIKRKLTNISSDKTREIKVNEGTKSIAQNAIERINHLLDTEIEEIIVSDYESNEVKKLSFKRKKVTPKKLNTRKESTSSNSCNDEPEIQNSKNTKNHLTNITHLKTDRNNKTSQLMQDKLYLTENNNSKKKTSFEIDLKRDQKKIKNSELFGTDDDDVDNDYSDIKLIQKNKKERIATPKGKSISFMKIKERHTNINASNGTKPKEQYTLKNWLSKSENFKSSSDKKETYVTKSTPTTSKIYKEKELSPVLENSQSLSLTSSLSISYEEDELDVYEPLIFKDISINELLDSFLQHKPVLDKIFNSTCTKIYTKGGKVVNHMLICKILEEDKQRVMLKKLSDIYDKSENDASASSFYSNVLLPEWIICIVKQKFKMTREQAIEKIKKQDKYALYLEVKESGILN